MNMNQLLHRAVNENKPLVVDFLLNDSDININNLDFYDMTTLMFASSLGHKECVILLLNKGADVNVQTQYGDTALDLAKKYHRDEIVQLLESHQQPISQLPPTQQDTQNITIPVELFRSFITSLNSLLTPQSHT